MARAGRSYTPKEVARNAMAKFVADMELFHEFICGPGACQICQNLMATVREDTQKARLSAGQIDKAVLEAQPLFIE